MNSIGRKIEEKSGTVGRWDISDAIGVADGTDNTCNSVIGIGDLIITDNKAFVDGVCIIIGRIDNMCHSIFSGRYLSGCFMARGDHPKYAYRQY